MNSPQAQSHRDATMLAPKEIMEKEGERGIERNREHKKYN